MTTVIPTTESGEREFNTSTIVVLVAGLSMLGQFAIATYLPAFSVMAQALHASSTQVQQSLSAYLLPFALMIPWHGAISDAIGRRRMILAGNVLFTIGALMCAAAPTMSLLFTGRALQGVGAGVGVVIGRAMVRDVFHGTDAQKIMALVAMVFALAPALAPVCGGWLLLWAGWRSIFIFLAILSASLVVVSWFLVPETLPPSRRHRLDPATLARAYATLFTKPRFVALALANAAVNLGIYLYVLAAPTFVVKHLGLGEQSFGYLFVPIVLGLIAGAAVAHRAAGRGSPARSVILGHMIMVVAGVINIGVNAMHASPLPWDLVALPIYGLGMMLTQPSLQVMALDCFPERRGLASSCYVTVQQFGNFLSSALLVPLLLANTLHMALGMAVLQCLGLLMFFIAMRDGRSD
ncbi:multidrug effflux MFS transporter [Paraburkholderia terrae]|uniref:multidrug effflux MFS transporter n=1 Tax=Paraburkholderia terrae TaxID=311230 RepID=UPI00296ABCE4|nr:multidrug effflux MFS transporter [Paraburkholderia terrae]MDW3659762.1 multidrug effflux MFS transporter [Paraburkholderia terrae]